MIKVLEQKDLGKINKMIKDYEDNEDKTSADLFLLVCKAYLLGLEG